MTGMRSSRVFEMESGFSKHRLAGKERLMDAFRKGMRPREKFIAPIGEGDEKSRVCNTGHGANPRLRLRPGSPSMLPARSRKGWRAFRMRENSNPSRTIWPLGSPVRFDSSSSHRPSSSGRRMVIVLLIIPRVRHYSVKCKT